MWILRGKAQTSERDDCYLVADLFPTRRAESEEKEKK